MLMQLFLFLHPSVPTDLIKLHFGDIKIHQYQSKHFITTLIGVLGFVEPANAKKAWLCRTCFVVHPSGFLKILFDLGLEA